MMFLTALWIKLRQVRALSCLRAQNEGAQWGTTWDDAIMEVRYYWQAVHWQRIQQVRQWKSVAYWQVAHWQRIWQIVVNSYWQAVRWQKMWHWKVAVTVSNKTVAMFVLIWLFWLYHCGDFCYKNVDKSNIVTLHPGYNSHTIMKVWNNFHKKIWAIYDRVCIATVLLLIFLNRKILSVDISCDIYYVLSCYVTCKRVNIT